jgi:tRNA (guanine37-N1)-methyltransferase
VSRLRVDVVTIFPDYLAPLSLSLIGQATAAGLVDIHVHDLRTWGRGSHNSVDDTSYGGGPGMVMRPDVWGDALDAVLAEGTKEGPDVLAAEESTGTCRPRADR